MNWLTLLLLLTALIFLPPCHSLLVSRLRRNCPDRLLKGGRVRLRSRGRVAKYVCLRGYQVLGDKYSTCIRGKWDTPVPTCISGGCLPIDVPHGDVIETYRGALVTVHCDPGYSLIGSQSVYCNGAVWNDTVPVCREINVRAKRFCDFESEDLCGWTHDLNHDFVWTRHNFATPSGHVGTGPSFDHTFGVGLSGHYMYLETSSPRLANDTARLFSPVFAAPTNPTSCFIFWYHMFGLTTGSLNVYVHTNDTLLLFSQSGDLGNYWKDAVLPLPPINSSFQIIIEGVCGTGYEGDTAIDDVKLSEGDECTAASSSTMSDSVSLTNTKSYEESSRTAEDISCENRCFNITTDASHCECTADCVNNNTCCPDYLHQCLSYSTAPESIVPTNEVQLTKLDHLSTLPTLAPTSDSHDMPTTINYNTLTTLNYDTPTTVQADTPQEVFSSSTRQTSGTSVVLPSSGITFPYFPVKSFNMPKVEIEHPSTQITKNSTSLPETYYTPETTFKISTPTIVHPTSITMKQSNTSPQTRSSTKQTQSSTKQTQTSTKQPTSSTVNSSLSTAVTQQTVNGNKTSTMIAIPTISSNPTTKPDRQITVTWRPVWPRRTTISYRRKKPFYILPTRKPWPSGIGSPTLEFVPPPSPVYFRTPAKTTLYQKPVGYTTIFSPTTLKTTTPNPKLYKSLTKMASKSKNNMFHPVWRKDTLPALPTPFPNRQPGNIRPTVGHTTRPSLQKTYTVGFSQKNFSEHGMPGNALETKWKSRDHSPVQGIFVMNTPSMVLVGAVLMILFMVLTTVCVVRRRRINRRSIEDDELDIRFLASDEILDFTLARPSPDDTEVCETRS